MLNLVLILLVVFAVLSLLLAAWTLFFQGYIYSEPVEAIFWRAPAAGAALTLFLGFWIFLDYRSVTKPNEEGRYRPLHELSAHETETYEHLWIVYRNGKEEHYQRQGDNKYRNKSGKEPLQQRPLKIIARHKDGEKHEFLPEEKDGRLRYYDEGDPSRYMEEGWPGQVNIFHFGWLAAGLLLNFGFLAVWFVCLWLLLRFQWPHALGLAFVAWLISLFVLPMLLTQAEKVRKERLPPPQTAAIIGRAYGRSCSPPAACAADKCVGFLQQGRSVVAVDTVTTRRADMNAAILSLLGIDVAAAATPSGLSAVSYQAVGREEESQQLQLWPAPLVLGKPLPTLPLWIASDFSLPLDSESSYTGHGGI